MKRTAWIAMAMMATCLSKLSTAARSADDASLQVVGAWARATPSGASVGAAYAEIHAPAGAGDKLLRVTTPAAGRAEIHTHINEDGVMKMRRLEALDVEPGTVVKLEPGGKHLMLFELKAPLTEGETLPLTLTFEKAGDVEVSATIAPIGAKKPSSGMAFDAAESARDKNGSNGKTGSHDGSHSGQD